MEDEHAFIANAMGSVSVAPPPEIVSLEEEYSFH